MDLELVKSLEKIVKNNYKEISKEFSDSRKHSKWLEFDVYKELCSKGMKVLDIGCGNGRLYWQSLRDQEVRYLGVDPCIGLLKEAEKPKSELKSIKEKRLVQFKEGNLTKIPAKKGEFDRVFCIAAFHHLPGVKRRIKALQELKRVTKKDGYIVISVWNLFQKRYRRYLLSSIWRFIKTGGRYAWNDTIFKWKGEGSERYYHAFTLSEMRALLRDNGLKIVQELYPDKDSIDASVFEAHNYVWICQKK